MSSLSAATQHPVPLEHPVEEGTSSDDLLHVAVERACASIAPAWPLDAFIAVNPFCQLIDSPITEVAARLARLDGTRLLMPRTWYRAEWDAGRLERRHLEEVVRARGGAVTVERLIASLDAPEVDPPVRGRLMDVVDSQRDLSHAMSFRDFVVNGTSQVLAAYFDDGQAQFGPPRDGGLYATFRRHAVADRSPPLLMGLRRYREVAARLPDTAEGMLRAAVRDLQIPRDELEPYLLGLLLDLRGWASWCAQLRWSARLRGEDDGHLVELLAVRLAWEWILLAASDGNLPLRWQREIASWGAAPERTSRPSRADDWLLQEAVELAFQEKLAAGLAARFSAKAPERPSAQAVFCIDVRSERLRFALEAVNPAVQTLGFAGFFGLPAEYLAAGTETPRAQLPGLLAPRLRIVDDGAPDGLAERRTDRLLASRALTDFKASPVGAFPFVEGLGLLRAGSLLLDAVHLHDPEPRDAAGLTRGEREALRPRLSCDATGAPLDVAARTALAANILRGMSLTRRFARLVLLAGHGSTSRNNPHAAGLDCGACRGQSGEVNARAAAALLNDAEVRRGLAGLGIVVPDDTRFIPGLHDTTTDEVALFDLSEVPSTHAADLAALRRDLEAAGARTRAARAPALGLSGDDAALRAAMHRRARDWAEVRPEWGLAGNAAFIVAPRERSRQLDLGGRAFLHEYRADEDPGSAVLEVIMTAPMIVTHWINMQYYASTVDNGRYGSGNKILHNVVGGHVGVFEGNGGDLRVGLSLQSLHDGERWVHAPLRLSVFIEAPASAIEGVIGKHPMVANLVQNGWLHLFRIDAGAGVFRYRDGSWERSAAAAG